MSGIIDIILGRPLVDDVDNAREPVVLYIGVGDPGLAVGRCAAERDVCLSILVSRVAPRPSGVLDHGVVADSQTGDGRADLLAPALSPTVVTRLSPFMTLNTKVWFGFAPLPSTVLVIFRLQVLTVMVNSAGFSTSTYVPVCVGETVHVTL